MKSARTESATRRSVRLPCSPSSAARARRVLGEFLTACGQLQWRDAAELAATEIVGNAVLHAHTDIELSMAIDDAGLRVEVRDFSPVLPMQRDYTEQATTGRGMALVAALTSGHGIAHANRHGKTVWFTLSDSTVEHSEQELIDAWADSAWNVDDADPLDRAEGDVTAPGETARTVRLLCLPSVLWLAAREHHDALIRELLLYLAEHDGLDVDVPAADVARARVSGEVAAAAAASPLGNLPEALDLELRIESELGPAFAAMQDTLDAAERLARDELLLVHAGLPEIVAVRDWVCEQITAQLAGVAPAPWPGTDQERFAAHRETGGSTAAGWDADVVRTSELSVVAADDSNRIIAVSPRLAELVGWAIDDLVGRRVVALIPPHLREAHVAGFTRHLTTGEARMLDVPMTLPVLHADGRELTCRFLVQRAAATRGRSVYLAWIDLATPDDRSPTS